MRKILLILMALVMAISLSGCMPNLAPQGSAGVETTPMPELDKPLYTDAQTVYALYNQVSFSDTLDDLTARLGQPQIEAIGDTENKSFNWIGENGSGVACAFSDAGKLLGKVLYYEDFRQCAGLMPGEFDIDAAANVLAGMTHQDVITLLGSDGIELAQVPQDNSANPVIALLYMWVNERGDMIQILFDTKDAVKQVSYSRVVEETPAPTAQVTPAAE
jgi:hypothetical protein